MPNVMTRAAGRPPAVATPAPAPAGAPPRRRTRGGILLLPPWSRAPFLVWREPVAVLAVVAAAAILGCAAASGTLFLSSAGSAVLQNGAAELCPDATDLVMEFTAPTHFGTMMDKAAREAVAGQHLPAAGELIVGPSPAGTFGPTTSGGRSASLRLVFRDGALSQITPTSARLPGSGVLVPTEVAAALHARPGATVDMAGQPVRVVGTYRNLTTEPVRPFWCSQLRLFVPKSGFDPAPPPLALATDAATADKIIETSGTGLAESEDAPAPDDPTALSYAWFVRVDKSDLTLTRARDLLARWQRVRSDAYNAMPGKAVQLGAADEIGVDRLEDVTHRAALIRHGLAGPVLPVALGGSLLALLLVGAAGSYWADRRMREVRLLASRGVGPVGLAGKALLELAVPAALGVLLGRWLAGLLVAGFGPSDDIEPSARAQALATTAVGLAGGLVLLAAVAGLRGRALVERPVGARRSRLLLVPWELALLGVAGWQWLGLHHTPGVLEVDGIAQPRPVLIAFPLVFLLAGGVLGVRLLALLLRPLRRRASRMRVAGYLAVSRITAAPAVSMLLMAALTVPAAMVVYSASITSSVQYTVNAKIRLFTGGRLTLQTVDTIRPTPRLTAAGTVVQRYPGTVTAMSSVTLLAVDPASFGRWAFWDSRFSSRSLAQDMRMLAARPADGAIPALAIRGQYQGDVVPDGYDLAVGDRRLRLSVVDRPAHFPGTRDTDAIVVISAANLPPINPFAVMYQRVYEVWGDDEAELQRAVADQVRTIPPLRLDAAIVISRANLAGLAYSFDFLTALAALVGVIAIGGLLLYLETRQRSRVTGYAMARRMGMRAASHRRSLLVEMATLVGMSAVLGGLIGVGGVLLVYRQLDFNTEWQPPPALSIPVATLALLGLVTVLVCAAAATYAHRAATRNRPAEILRLAD